MNYMKNTIWEMRKFLLLWLTQSFSGLGSAMTSYALVVWSYTQEDSAFAGIGVCLYFRRDKKIWELEK